MSDEHFLGCDMLITYHRFQGTSLECADAIPGTIHDMLLDTDEWISEISRSNSSVTVDLTQDEIKASPLSDPTILVNRGYEANLYDYYGRKQY